MKKNIKFLTMSVLVFVASLACIVSVAATKGRAALGHGDSITLEEQNVGTPVTIIRTDSTTSSANIRATIQRKGLLGYSKAGTKDLTVKADLIYTITWNGISGTKDTKATWKNTETSVGYVVIGEFELK